MNKSIVGFFFLAVSPLVWGQPQITSDRQNDDRVLRELRKTAKGIGDVKRSLEEFERKEKARRIAEESAAKERDARERKRVSDLEKESQRRANAEKITRDIERQATMRAIYFAAGVAIVLLGIAIALLLRKKQRTVVIELTGGHKLELIPGRLEILVNPDIPTLRKAFREERVVEKAFVLELGNRGTEFDGKRFDCVAKDQGEKLDPLVRFKIDPDEEWVAFKNAPRKAIKLAQTGLAA